MSLYDTADHSTIPLPLVKCKKRIQPQMPDAWHHSGNKKRIQTQMPDAQHQSGQKMRWNTTKITLPLRNVRKGFKLRFQMLSINLATRKGFNLRFQMLSINLARSLPNQDYPSSSKMLEKDSTPDARCLASIWPPGEVEHRTNSVHPTKITPPPVQCKKRIMPQMEDAWHQSGHQMKWSTMTTENDDGHATTTHMMTMTAWNM
ncbi:hypothetical protein F5J12DRAFT_787751 [Pisolithus orientalis]|uniref:uncharacterized protein n=1 Tax=Pisolithus orientalis TaxID=936130 RepID=UPI002225A7AC|nr:uncharacterized protein F5J12DRAFT_787751 [Pisolithus orientalis]KAI5983688.1 hypothetical protein F5J12DRAFT_787751 [Pisolithus orientalis]